MWTHSGIIEQRNYVGNAIIFVFNDFHTLLFKRRRLVTWTGSSDSAATLRTSRQTPFSFPINDCLRHVYVNTFIKYNIETPFSITLFMSFAQRLSKRRDRSSSGKVAFCIFFWISLIHLFLYLLL